MFACKHQILKVIGEISKSLLFIIIDIQYVFLFHAGSCDGYTNITEPWRNVLYTSSSFPGYPKNDLDLVNKWWRFTGIGGDRIISSCHGGPIAGASHGMNVPFSYPTTESESPTVGTAYGDTSCNAYSFSMSLVLCPGGFYIYKPSSHPHSSMGYPTCKE